MGRFREACGSAVLSGAHGVRKAAEAAYEHLLAQLRLGETDSTDQLLRVVGVLAGHYCDAPVQMGTYSSSRGFVATVAEGRRVDAREMADALLVVGAPALDATAASFAGEELERISRRTLEAATWSQIDRVYEGATGRLDHDDVNLDADDLTLLTAFVALANHSLQAARAYLQGSAGHCAVALVERRRAHRV